MRLIHTADWHLGKHLEGRSRLEEQELFLEDFVTIVKEKEADIVLIAGDVYDSPNPPARAEQLFYDTLKRISDGGKRVTVVIAGNHDNPERLVSATPLAMEHGLSLIHILGKSGQETVRIFLCRRVRYGNVHRFVVWFIKREKDSLEVIGV